MAANIAIIYMYCYFCLLLCEETVEILFSYESCLQHKTLNNKRYFLFKKVEILKIYANK